MKYKLALSLIICSIVSPLTWAAIPSDVIVTGYIGYSNFINNPGSTIKISNYVTDSLNNTNQLLFPSFGASVKQKFFLNNRLLDSIAIGPAAYYQKAQFKGQVWELELPEFYNYNYDYTSENLSLLIESDVYFHPLFSRFYPFVMAGAGLGIAQVKYDDDAVLGIPTDSELHLGSKSNNHLTYEVGAGVMVPIDCHLSAGIRYSYMHLGTVHTSTRATARIMEPIPAKLNSNNVFLSLIYSV